MKSQSLQIFALILVAFSNNTAKAIPVPVLDVPSLLSASSLVVIGSVDSMRDVGATTITSSGSSVVGRLLLCDIEVEGVLKGTVQSGARIVFRYIIPSEPIGYSSIVVGYQMIFLKRVGSEYELTSPYHASLPAVGDSGSDSGDELTRVTVCLGNVLRSSSASTRQKQIALHAVSTIKNPESTTAIREALKESDPTIRLNAAGFLLLRNDISGMPAAEEVLTHPQGVPWVILHNLDYAIQEGLRDERAIPALSRIAQAHELETRRAIVSALSHTGSHEALRPLARFLADEDIQVRHEAVLGLAEITGDLEWGPNFDLFRSREQQYLNHWRDWASANGLTR